MVIRLSLVMGLLALVYALVTQNLLVALGIAVLPAASLVILHCVRHPRMGILLYFFASYFLMAIWRYTQTDGWSVMLNILLVLIAITTIIHVVVYKGTIRWTNGFNILITSYAVWMLFILIQLRYTTSDEYVMAIREWLVAIPVLYFIASVLLDNLKALRIGLITLGIFTIIATAKALYQKYVGFDATEMIWLMSGAATTHLLQSGIRYPSIFSDAGNFGIHMGLVTVVYFLIGFLTTNKLLRLFYLSISGMAVLSLFMSGTRSAIAVPLVGFALFMLLSLKPKIMISTAIAGILVYAFFAFTTIGEGNSMIRRMRTAFRPTEDASFNVRVENQKEIAEYLKTHPWGAGLRGEIPRTVEINGEYIESTIPPDSYFVRIWIQTGTGGLLVYIVVYVLILLRCCYVVMFLIRNQRLRLTLAALLSGVVGMMVNGYAGEAMGMPPNDFLIPAMLAFVLNGPYIDKTECTSTTINT
jgi:hypothetical protein